MITALIHGTMFQPVRTRGKGQYPVPSLKLSNQWHVNRSPQEHKILSILQNENTSPFWFLSTVSQIIKLWSFIVHFVLITYLPFRTMLISNYNTLVKSVWASYLPSRHVIVFQPSSSNPLGQPSPRAGRPKGLDEEGWKTITCLEGRYEAHTDFTKVL